MTAIDRLTAAIAGERRDWHVVEAKPDDVAAVLAVVAAARAEPTLDVERLARALHVTTDANPRPYETCPQTLDGWHDKSAAVIAREYARLATEVKL